MISVGVIYLIIIGCCYAFLWPIDRDKVLQSLRLSWKSLLKLLPLLVAIFGLVGLFQVLVTPEMLASLFQGNPFLDTLIGTLSGAASAGNPIVSITAELMLSATALIYSGDLPFKIEILTNGILETSDHYKK